ncbi:hypothetical protein L914_11040 [Phytophthora nicotianae]|uniref:Uncharacterized protein n=1 Tax=Phytophthora nicotianae TaxID=4792 RepID=W2N6Z6_PHYNI|nr:hypothetical protein L914_11040 [Phytophthora nicotianae]
MSYLPNRIYYPELKDMDSDRLHQTLINVLLYSLLELISLVVLDVVLRRLVHFSPVSQLAFVLKTQWRMERTTASSSHGYETRRLFDKLDAL